MKIILLLLQTLSALPQRQIRAFHGLFSSCKLSHLLTRFSPLIFKCVEIGEYQQTLDDLNKQILKGCLALLQEEVSDPRIFENGIYLIGSSLGGIVVRGIYQFCQPLRSKIKKIVLMGAPNLGITSFPFTSNSFIANVIKPIQDQITEVHQGVDWINNEIRDLIMNNPLLYDKLKDYSVFQLFVYLRNGNEMFISDLMKQLNFSNFSYDDLELLVTYSYTQEYVINPKISTSFGAHYDHKMTPFSQYEFYLKGFLKLNKMYDRGDFVLCVVRGEHVEENEFD